MNRKIIQLDKLEATLEELFGLSEDERSEDGYESDERENEAIFTQTGQEELENILNSPSSSRSCCQFAYTYTIRLQNMDAV
ncbi:unnamed protein product [Parnassius apollo]|uniref:(apollo) hypothetical protein n=1 Tax=Parnassius apollo TaxID=110799 RepID=A0A8S3Y2X8_PARAO|nr:unnamed protein product [Parnassius apollo]